MKNKKNKKNLLLIVEAFICIGLCIFGGSNFNLTNELLSFPFKQISLTLRRLSMLNGVGNVFSWILFILICSTPIIVGLIKWVRKSFVIEEILLIVISIVLTPAIYYMINSESIVSDMVINPSREQLTWILAAIIYSVVVSYVLIKIVRCFIKAEKQDLKKYLNHMLFIINVILIIGIFGISLEQLVNKLASYKDMNYVLKEDITVTYTLMIMNYVIDVVFNLMVIGIIILVQGFIDKINIENITDDVVNRVKLVSKCCVVTIIIYAILTICYNILQLVYIKELFAVNGVVSFPFGIVVAMLVIMLLIQLVLDAKYIKEENDMFI